MKCENCNEKHDGSYGSGRFCSVKCARGFSTKNKRKEINEKVSNTLTGRKQWGGKPFKKGYDPRREKTKEVYDKIAESLRQNWIDKYNSLDFDEMSGNMKRKYILEKQENKCLHCGLSEWLGKPLKFELDHIDGNTDNNEENNLRMLCPNCHSFTPTWRKRKIISADAGTGRQL